MSRSSADACNREFLRNERQRLGVEWCSRALGRVELMQVSTFNELGP